MTTNLTEVQRGTLAKWLADHTPAEVDRALASRALLQQNVKVEALTDYDPKHGRVFKGVAVQGPAENYPATLEAYRASMLPAPERVVEEWLVDMSVLTIPRNDDDLSASLRLAAYTRQLAAYPADAVRAALLGRPWKFFPSWAELHGVLEEAVRPRRAAIARLEFEIQRAATAEPDRGPPASKEAVARIMQEVYGKKRVANGRGD